MSAIDVRKLTPEQREDFHKAAETRIKPFHYAKPASSHVKEVEMLTKSDLMKVMVQVVRDGGENNLHYHTGSDTTWMVLKGRVRFYGVHDRLIGEFGLHEGVFMPGGSRYWFEKAGDEELELLQMVAYDRSSAKAERINVDAHKEWMTESELKVYE